MGIILVTLIFTLTERKEKLSDQEIIDRARTLGMVTEEDSDKELNQLLESIKPSDTAEPSAAPADTPTAAPTEAPVDSPTDAPSPAPTDTPTAAPSAAPTDSKEADPTPTIALTPTPVPTKAPEVTPVPTVAVEHNQQAGDDISFTIKRGMSSGEVASLLADIGLIEDADDFNRYIETSGKASIIRVGSYTLPKGSTYDEIVTKITTRQ